MLAGAIDEDGFVLRREPPDDWPLPHAILRDKGCACDATKNGDVMPREMVGHEEHIMAQSRAVNLDPRTQHPRDNAQIEHRPRGRQFQSLPDHVQRQEDYQRQTNQHQSRPSNQNVLGFDSRPRDRENGQIWSRLLRKKPIKCTFQTSVTTA